jgi:hypothetical protein
MNPMHMSYTPNTPTFVKVSVSTVLTVLTVLTVGAMLLKDEDDVAANVCDNNE